jgi:thiol-disulfide isomerase/thioredoxin
MKKVIKFSADRCGSCKRYESVFELVKNDLKNIEFISYDEEKDIEKFMEYNISVLPTTIYINGDEEKKHGGYMSPADLYKFLLS